MTVKSYFLLTQPESKDNTFTRHEEEIKFLEKKIILEFIQLFNWVVFLIKLLLLSYEIDGICT